MLHFLVHLALAADPATDTDASCVSPRPEVARVLAPGGRWVIVDMVEHDREEYRTTMGHQHLGFGEGTLRGLGEAAGLILRAWRVLPPDPVAHGPALFVAVLRR